MTNFYTFTDNSFSEVGERFAWASSIIPRSPVISRICETCEGVTWYPESAFDVVIDEDGEVYPDILGCGAYPFLILSERVVQIWNEAKICCFHTFPVNVVKVESEILRVMVPPHYFRIEIDGKCRIDLDARGMGLYKICPECKRILIPSPMEDIEKGFFMIPDSWDHSDLFRDAKIYPRVNFCTERVLESARLHRLTNFRFDPMEEPFDLSSDGIDYLK